MARWPWPDTLNVRVSTTPPRSSRRATVSVRLWGSMPATRPASVVLVTLGSFSYRGWGNPSTTPGRDSDRGSYQVRRVPEEGPGSDTSARKTPSGSKPEESQPPGPTSDRTKPSPRSGAPMTTPGAGGEARPERPRAEEGGCSRADGPRAQRARGGQAVTSSATVARGSRDELATTSSTG